MSFDAGLYDDHFAYRKRQFTTAPDSSNLRIYRYNALLVHFPHLQIADGNRDIARRAAQLRAHYHLRPAHALQAATALRQGGTALVSNDSQLGRLAGTLDVVLLDDLV